MTKPYLQLVYFIGGPQDGLPGVTRALEGEQVTPPYNGTHYVIYERRGDRMVFVGWGAWKQCKTGPEK